MDEQAMVDIDGFAGQLGPDHPGVNDPGYRQRRAEIAQIALDYRRGEPIPHAPYTEEEHAVWRKVSQELYDRHRRFAIRDFVASGERLGLPKDRIPQLDEVGDLLEPLTGFRYEPVAGLVAPRDFYSSLDDGYFRSTQYIRHSSVPRYTPEPDVIHEVVGHATMLADEDFAELYRQMGRAIKRCETDEAVRFLSRVFWFTMEFGAVHEDGEPKAYGAGLLSSYGEIESFRDAELKPWDILAMGTTSYDITMYQSGVFVADSLAQLKEELGELFTSYDDAVAERYLAQAA